ncbi:MAG: DUF4330 domain-containing protein [Firmicutes bacterium]|nr:DUF4330 domain-containing protein [Bacillota bacterium]
MEKSKAKFSVIDAVIILVVLAAIAVGVKMLLPRFISSGETKTVECTVLLSSTEKELAEAMSEGDNVTISLTEKDGGTIKAIEVKNAERSTFDSMSGAFVTQELENKFDIYVTIELEAEITDTAIQTGTTVLKVGSEIPVRGKGYAATGYCIGIND